MSADTRVTLVTGGARRLGAAIVRSFAERGDAVVIHHGNSQSEAQALADELRSAGSNIHVLQADLSGRDAPKRIVDEVMDVFARIDTLISSASVMKSTPFDTVTPEAWDEIHAINLRAPFFLMQAAARCMTSGGCMIQLSDHLAFESIYPALIPHQVSKSALSQMVRSIADALAPKIRVNAVAPGMVLPPENMSSESRQRFLKDVPLDAVGTPQDVIDAIHYLVDARYVTGTVLRVDGGRHLRR